MHFWFYKCQRLDNLDNLFNDEVDEFAEEMAADELNWNPASWISNETELIEEQAKIVDWSAEKNHSAINNIFCYGTTNPKVRSSCQSVSVLVHRRTAEMPTGSVSTFEDSWNPPTRFQSLEITRDYFDAIPHLTTALHHSDLSLGSCSSAYEIVPWTKEKGGTRKRIVDDRWWRELPEEGEVNSRWFRRTNKNL